MITIAGVARSNPKWRLPSWRAAWSVKVLLALVTAAAADALFQPSIQPGATFGILALIVLGALVLSRGRASASGVEAAAGTGATLMALALIEEPSFLAIMLCWSALVTLSLVRQSVPKSAVLWLRAVAGRSVQLWFAPLADLPWLTRARRRRHGRSIVPMLQLFIVPLILGAIFVLLFAAANPLLDRWLSSLDVTALGITIGRVIVWVLAFTAVYGLTRWRWRSRRRHVTTAHGPAPSAAQTRAPRTATTWLTAASVMWSLVVFNLLFALQNLSDMAFLWGGATLPDGFTFAEYAHHGAYPLIATALLAAGFVLVALRPGSETASDRRVRLLVLAWIGQNALLALSAMLRTLDYIQSYSLTVLRLSAMLWMALVLLGLILVIVRVARGKSNTWLINANVIAALVLLGGCAIADLRGIVADYNVRHCKEVTGAGVELHFWYLDQLGASAMPALYWLQSQPVDPFIGQAAAQRFRDRLATLEYQQSDWRSWTFRGYRLLEDARDKELVVSLRLLPKEEPGPYTSAASPTAAESADP